MFPTGNPRNTRRPPSQSSALVGSSSGIGVGVTRPSTDETRQLPREVDNTRLNAPSGPSSSRDSAVEMKERSTMDDMRHDANVKSKILRSLMSFGIPCHDARVRKSERTTVSARYSTDSKAISTISDACEVMSTRTRLRDLAGNSMVIIPKSVAKTPFAGPFLKTWKRSGMNRRNTVWDVNLFNL